jgi:uncharacterized protein YciI
MPLFMVVGLDHPPHSMALREKLRDAHRGYVLERTDPIRFAGATVDAEGNQSGSLYVFEADRIETVRAWFAAEPFAAGGVYASLEIRPLRLAYNQFDKVAWPGTRK